VRFSESVEFGNGTGYFEEAGRDVRWLLFGLMTIVHFAIFELRASDPEMMASNR
jgi:hypothetical protein